MLPKKLVQGKIKTQSECSPTMMWRMELTVPTQRAADTADPEKLMNDMQGIIDDRTNKTARQLSSEIAGDTTFPGRDVWERNLFAQHQHLIASAQAVVDAAKKMRNAPSANER